MDEKVGKGWIYQKWLDMGLNRSKRLDNLEKWLDKPKMVRYKFYSIGTVGYLEKVVG